MTYESAERFAETWGGIILGTVFAIACVYALWPSNRGKFKRAASAPLAEEDDDVR